MNIGKLNKRYIKKNLLNLRFSKLTVIELEPKHKDGSVRWKCQCDCGNTITAIGRSLLKGATKDCGCERNKHQFAEGNPKWKGGRLNKGSIAWANYILGQAKCKENGISKEVTGQDLLDLIDESKGECMLCGKKQTTSNRRFCIDHNHTTGNLRGILCVSCNTGIGQFSDSIEKLEKAIEYLKTRDK